MIKSHNCLFNIILAYYKLSLFTVNDYRGYRQNYLYKIINRIYDR
jgi:hypothetical protein